MWEGAMKGRNILGLAMLAAAALALAPGGAEGQAKLLKQQIVGTWTLAAWEQTLADGTKVKRFGDHPKGIHVFMPDGRFFLMIARRDLPRIASKDSLNPSPEEAKALSVGTIAYYGVYSVNEKDRTISETLEASTFPNQLDVAQVRTVTAITPTEMHFGNTAAVGGGHIDMTWRRIK